MATNPKQANGAAERPVQKGFYGLAIGVVAYVFVVMYLQLTIAGPDSMNILMGPLTEKFHMNPGQVMGGIASVRLVGVVAGIFAGWLIMKAGYRNVGVPSIILCGVFVAMMGRVDTWTGIMVIQTALTILTPVLMFTQGGMIANWFVRKKGMVFGIVTISAPLSTATFTPIGMPIFMKVGFAPFYTGLGLIIAIVGLLGIVFMKEKPEDFGFAPDGIAFTPEELVELEKMKKKEGLTAWPILRLLACKEFWFIGLGWGLIGGLMMAGIMSQVIPILTGSGIELNRALGLMSGAALLGMPLSYVWGWIDDKIGTPKTNAVFSLSYLIGAVGFAYGGPDSVWLLYIAMFAVSLGVGGMPNLMPSLIAYTFGRDEFVNISRWVNVYQAILMSAGMYYLAKMNDVFGSYSFAFKTFIPISIFCGICFLLIRKSLDPERLALQDHEKNVQ
jgi:MFS family permease